MSYIRINAKVSVMSHNEAVRRREELYRVQQSNIESERAELYMELGLIEQRFIDVYSLFRLPFPLLGERRHSLQFDVPFRWVQPPSF